jgi:hypothetical protein
MLVHLILTHMISTTPNAGAFDIDTYDIHYTKRAPPVQPWNQRSFQNQTSHTRPYIEKHIWHQLPKAAQDILHEASAPNSSSKPPAQRQMVNMLGSHDTSTDHPDT